MFSSGVMEMLQNYTQMMAVQHCEYTKCHWNVHFKMINDIWILLQSIILGKFVHEYEKVHSHHPNLHSSLRITNLLGPNTVILISAELFNIGGILTLTELNLQKLKIANMLLFNYLCKATRKNKNSAQLHKVFMFRNIEDEGNRFSFS